MPRDFKRALEQLKEEEAEVSLNSSLLLENSLLRRCLVQFPYKVTLWRRES